MIVTRTEKHLICKSHIAWKEIDNLTFYSKNLFNHANYIIRHTMFETGKILTYNQVFNLCKDSDEYKQMGSNVGQATLRMLDKAWKSFAMSTKKYYENPKIFLGKPKLPKYLNKNGRFVCALDNNKVGIKDGAGACKPVLGGPSELPHRRSSSSAPRRDSTEPRPRGCSGRGEPPHALPSF